LEGDGKFQLVELTREIVALMSRWMTSGWLISGGTRRHPR